DEVLWRTGSSPSSASLTCHLIAVRCSLVPKLAESPREWHCVLRWLRARRSGLWAPSNPPYRSIGIIPPVEMVKGLRFCSLAHPGTGVSARSVDASSTQRAAGLTTSPKPFKSITITRALNSMQKSLLKPPGADDESN